MASISKKDGKRPVDLTVQIKRRSFGSASGVGRSPSFAGSVNTQGSIHDPEAHLEQTFNLAIAARERSQRLLGQDANPESPVTDKLFMQDQDFKVNPSFLKNKDTLLETFNLFREATAKIINEISPEDYAKEKNDKNSAIRKFLSASNRFERLYSYNHKEQTLVIPSGLEDQARGEEEHDLSRSVENVKTWDTEVTIPGQSSKDDLDKRMANVQRVLSGFDEAASSSGSASKLTLAHERSALTHGRSVSFSKQVDARSDSGNGSKASENPNIGELSQKIASLITPKLNSERASNSTESTAPEDIAAKAKLTVEGVEATFNQMRQERESMESLKVRKEDKHLMG